MFSIRKLLIKLAHAVLKFAIEARGGQAADLIADDAPPTAAGDFKLPPLGADATHENTVWIPRILWALEWAKRNGAEPANAAAIARILQDEAKFKVAATNTARAFRSLKADKRGAGLWSGDKEYRITADGRKVLARLLG